MPNEPPNVVRLFFDDHDLEAAWARLDLAMRVQHNLYQDADSTEASRLAATIEATEAEAAFKHIYRRTRSPALARA